MSNGNSVTVVGNVTRDPELRFTPSGQAVASFGLAVNRRFQRNNEWEETTSFFDVVAWGTLGENCCESLSRGSRAIVTGRLEQRSWDDKESGDKRSKIEIIADEIGPSLRWATASVTKNERKGPGDGGSGGYSGGGQGGGGGQQQGGPRGGGYSGSGQGSGGSYADDEEPF